MNRRRHARYPYSAPIRVYAGEAPVDGLCVNISESGMLVQVPEPIPVATNVNFRVDEMDLKGSGEVRHSGGYGRQYYIGLEFQNGLTWAPSRPVARPPGMTIAPLLYLVLFGGTIALLSTVAAITLK